MPVFSILGTNLGFYSNFRLNLDHLSSWFGRFVRLESFAMAKSRTPDKPTKEDLRASLAEKRKYRIDLTVDELAVLKDCSKRTIERLYKDLENPNKLKATYNKGLVRFTWDNIEEFDRIHSHNSWLSLLNLTDEDVADMFDNHGNLT